MLYRIYQWLLSLLPDSWTEPIEQTAGTGTETGTAGTGAGYSVPAGGQAGDRDTWGSDATMAGSGTLQEQQDIPQAPPPDDNLLQDDTPNSRGSRSLPRHGTEQQGQEAQEQEPHQPEQKPPEIVFDFKPKRKRKDRGEENGRGGR